MAAPTPTAGRAWTRRYPPLLLLVVGLALVVGVFPSALRLPQANPATTPEYAPVPSSKDKTAPPPDGNLSALGLGSTSGLLDQSSSTPGGPNGAATTTTLYSGSNGVVGRNPSTKQCVGNPPRQTDDPLSPPCVGFFKGDNGGATYAGVTGDEVRILFYMESGSYCGTSQGCANSPVNAYEDLEKPPDSNEFPVDHELRVWQRYFNERFQTYGRTVHFFVFWTQSYTSSETPDERRADADANYATVKPFAVISFAKDNGEDYTNAMAQHGALNFGSYYERANSDYTAYPKLIWGYPPSMEIAASLFSSYVCHKVINHPVSFSGNVQDSGKTRVLGFLSSADPTVPVFEQYGSLVKSQIEACGGTFAVSRTFPVTGHITYDGTDPSYAASNIAAFKAAGVTTIIWAQGWETHQSKAAATAGYLPEWVVAGDGLSEGNNNGQFQDPVAWDHAVEVTSVTSQPVTQDKPCYKAYADTEPSAAPTDISGYGCWLYPNILEVFTGIQVAGPRLSPQSVNDGFHAIPPLASTNPAVPACFFETNDYTCVKDAQAEWFDSTAQSPSNSQPGCYRMIQAGKRYLTGTWPDGDVMAQRQPNDPCNGYDGDNTV